MNKDINYYLAKGFDKTMAQYYANGRKKIVAVTANSNFTLTLTFDNNEQRLLDCKPFLTDGTVFSFLKSYDNFKRVYIDDTNCIAWDKDPNIDSAKYWNNKIDLSPDTCYVDSTPIK